MPRRVRGRRLSHPPLEQSAEVEFARSIVENRKPRVNEKVAADWTAAGICAHESAMKGGRGVVVPRFD